MEKHLIFIEALLVILGYLFLFYIKKMHKDIKRSGPQPLHHEDRIGHIETSLKAFNWFKKKK